MMELLEGRRMLSATLIREETRDTEGPVTSVTETTILTTPGGTQHVTLETTFVDAESGAVYEETFRQHKNRNVLVSIGKLKADLGDDHFVVVNQNVIRPAPQ